MPDTPQRAIRIFALPPRLGDLVLPIRAQYLLGQLATFTQATRVVRVKRVHDFVGDVESPVGHGRVPGKRFGDLMERLEIPHQVPVGITR